MKNQRIFLQADSAQAEARVIFLLANDEEALELVDKIDYHALTATWFFGLNEELHNYEKSKLGYEHPIRFCGKTLRHAFHLGAGKRRAAITVNTDARKYKIPIQITEQIAEKALKIASVKQPRIKQVFQYEVIECLKKTRTLIAPIPYGFNSKIGGLRTFYERWGDELNRQAFSYIPQRAVSDNTKGAAIRIRKRIKGIRIVMESHDALLFNIREREVDEFGAIIKEEMERPIRFHTCSLPRRSLIIPCELETGYNYQELKKFKFLEKKEDIKIIRPEPIEPTIRPMTVNDKFYVASIPGDSKLDDLLYHKTLKE